jgi:multidrug resistance efflux pump
MDTVVAELVTFFQALKGGSLFVLAPVLIGLALTIAAVAYQVIAIRRFQAASKATQENFETIAADLRKRALEVKKQDEGLRKRDLEAKERDELKGFVKDANAELTEQPQRSQQQQVLKGSRRALKESVSQIIVVGLEDIQNRMLQTDFTGMTSVVFAIRGRHSAAGRQTVAGAHWHLGLAGPARQ